MFDLAILENITPETVFAKGGSDLIIVTIKEKAMENYNPDVYTETGRKEITSLAYTVGRSKTFLDDKGKTLKDVYQEKIKPIDAERKKIRDSLEALQEEIKKPLNDWNAEQAKIKADKEAKILKDLEDTKLAHEKAERDKLEAEKAEIARRQAEIARQQAEIKAQQDAIDAENKRKAKEEQDKIDAENARIKAEQLKEEARLLAEKKAKEEAEFKEKARIEAEKKAKEDAEKAIKEANDRALKAEEKAKADAENLKIESEKKIRQAEADAKKKIDEQNALFAKQMKEKADKEIADKKKKDDEEAKIKADNDKRQADLEHRSKVMTVAKLDLSALGIEEEMAKKIVKAIAKGNIRNVKITF